jgi:hypothetical protein
MHSLVEKNAKLLDVAVKSEIEQYYVYGNREWTGTVSHYFISGHTVCSCLQNIFHTVLEYFVLSNPHYGMRFFSHFAYFQKLLIFDKMRLFRSCSQKLDHQQQPQTQERSKSPQLITLG